MHNRYESEALYHRRNALLSRYVCLCTVQSKSREIKIDTNIYMKHAACAFVELFAMEVTIYRDCRARRR